MFRPHTKNKTNVVHPWTKKNKNLEDTKTAKNKNTSKHLYTSKNYWMVLFKTNKKIHFRQTTITVKYSHIFYLLNAEFEKLIDKLPIHLSVLNLKKRFQKKKQNKISTTKKTQELDRQKWFDNRTKTKNEKEITEKSGLTTNILFYSISPVFIIIITLLW